MNVNFRDLTGERFGKLVAIRRLANRGGRVLWECSCDCGVQTEVLSTNLTRVHTTSCGCVKRERCEESRTTHGLSKAPIYSVWRNMLNRCENSRVRAFKDYGGRGIRVCERWHVFENFYADMGNIPAGKTLDRIDFNGNYEPSNCRWATLVEQASNTRKNRFVTHNGKTQTVSAWAREVGLTAGRLGLRLAKGWSVEKALSTPLRKMKRKSEWQTQQLT